MFSQRLVSFNVSVGIDKYIHAKSALVVVLDQKDAEASAVMSLLTGPLPLFYPVSPRTSRSSHRLPGASAARSRVSTTSTTTPRTALLP